MLLFRLMHPTYDAPGTNLRRIILIWCVCVFVYVCISLQQHSTDAYATTDMFRHTHIVKHMGVSENRGP